jgi:hypothetical protein
MFQWIFAPEQGPARTSGLLARLTGENSATEIVVHESSMRRGHRTANALFGNATSVLMGN